MSLVSWLSGLKSSTLNRRVGQKRRNVYGNPERNVALEQLEPRTMLAAVMWDGGGGDFEWNNALNWNTDALPGADDDVTIDFGANDFTVVHSGGEDSINSLNSFASLDIAGGSLLVNSISTIESDLRLKGTLGGTANITVAGLFTWTTDGGYSRLRGVGGLGSLTANGGLLLDGIQSHINSHVLEGGFRLINPVGQTATWISGSVDLYEHSFFDNYGIIDQQIDAHLGSNDSLSEFNNYGTFIKSGGTGNLPYGSWLAVGTIHNSGTIDVSVGALTLGYFQGTETTNTGTIHGATGTLINFFSTTTSAGAIDGDHVTFAAGLVSGTFQANRIEINGTVEFNSNDIIYASSLSISAGILAGSGTVSVSGLTTLSGNGGGFAGSGILNANGGLSITSTVNHFNLSQRTINLGGYSSFTGGPPLRVSGGAVINVLPGAVFDLIGDVGLADFGGGTQTFNNAGTVRKSGTDGSYVGIGGVFNNTGSVEVSNGGTLYLGPGGTSTGSFSVGSGSLLGLWGMDLTESSSVSGTGTVILDDVDVRGTYDVTGQTSSFHTITFFPTANVLSIGSAFSIQGGTTTFNTGNTVIAGSLSITAGTLAGPDTVTVLGETTLFGNGGGFAGSGILNANGGLSITSTVNHFNLSQRTINLGGYSSFTGGPPLRVSGGAVINVLPGAVFDLIGDVGLADFGGGTQTFNNAGTVRKSGTDGSYVGIGGVFNNTGSVEVSNGGTLYLGPGGTSTGSFSVGSGSLLGLWGMDLTESSSVSGTGTVILDDVDVRGTYDVTGQTSSFHTITFFPTANVLSIGSAFSIQGGTTTFNTGNTVIAGSLSITAGTLAGPDTVTVLGETTLFGNGGGFAGSGILNANGGLSITSTVNHFNLSQRTINLGGYSSFTGGPPLRVSGGAVINVLPGAVFDLIGDVGLADFGGGTQTFNNAGTVRKSGTDGSYVGIGGVFNNTGSVEVSNGGTLYLGPGGTSTGSFSVGSGSLLGLWGMDLTESSSVSGAGTVILDDVDVRGTYDVTGQTSSYSSTLTGIVLDVGQLVVFGFTEISPVSGPTTLTIPSLTLTGTLRGSDDFLVTGAFNWTGGTLQGVDGRGSLMVLSDFNLDRNYTVSEFTLINAAHMTWTGGTVQFFGTTGGFVNAAGATFDDQIDGTFGSVDGNCLRFVNDGHFIKSGSTGVTYLQMQLYNRGTVEIQEGQLYLGCGYVGSPGNPPGPGIDPGPTPPSYEDPDPDSCRRTGPLSFRAAYTQTVSGQLIEQIAGHSGAGSYGTPGTDYGQLVVNGDVALNGTFSVEVIGGFVPSLGQQYMAIDNRGTHAITGTFNNLPEGSIVWAGNYGFLVTYVGGDGNDFVLTMHQFSNTPPVANAGGPYTVDEGGTLELSGAGSYDAQQTTSSLIYDWDLDGDGVFGESGANAGRGDENVMNPVFSAHGLDGPGTFTVSLRVTDGFGAFHVVSATIHILNVAPTVTLTGPATASSGQTKHYTFTTTDPGTDTFSVVATSGGSVGTVSNIVFNSHTGAGSFDVTFSSGPASSAVSIQLQDSDGAMSNVATVTVTVAPTYTLSGLVFSDFNNDGEVNFGERAIEGVVIRAERPVWHSDHDNYDERTRDLRIYRTGFRTVLHH